MGKKPINKMPIAERAKQFAPYAALGSMGAEMAKVERIVVEPKLLTPEAEEELDRKLHLLSPGMMIDIVYYEESEYVKKTGAVAKIIKDSRILQVVDKKIPFDNILMLEWEKNYD